MEQRRIQADVGESLSLLSRTKTKTHFCGQMSCNRSTDAKRQAISRHMSEILISFFQHPRLMCISEELWMERWIVFRQHSQPGIRYSPVRPMSEFARCPCRCRTMQRARLQGAASGGRWCRICGCGLRA